ITDTGPITSPARFEDVLLDSLSVVRQSGNRDLSHGAGALRAAEGGLVVLVAGRLSAAEARRLAASRRDGCPAIALLLAVSTWGDSQVTGASPVTGREPDEASADSGAGGPRAAGWRVASVDTNTPLALAWQRLPRFAGAAGPSGPAVRMPEAAV